MSADRMAVGGQPGRETGPASLARFRLVAGAQPLDRACTVVAVIGIAWLTIRRWTLLGPYPPGLDGAQWLALGRGMHGLGRSTDGAYAPLVPLLAAIADAYSGPLTAVRLLAVLSGLAVSLAVWLVARDALGPVWGLVVTAFVVPASVLAEPVLYGGYPQLFALASGIVALWASCRFLTQTGDSDTVSSRGTRDLGSTPGTFAAQRDSSRPLGRTHSPCRRTRSANRSLWLAGVFALLTATAHHIYYPLFALSIAVAIVLSRPYRAAFDRRSRIRTLALAFVPSLITFGGIAFAFVSAGYRAPLEASARTPFEAWRYSTREAPFLWLLVLVFGAVSLAVSWRSRRRPQWLLAAGLIIPATVLFLRFGQPRLLPPLIIGAAIAAGLGARRLAEAGIQGRPATVFLAVTIAAALIAPADRAVSGFAEFYTVVDDSLVGATAAIEDDDAPGAVAVRQDRRGWPIGWWFEALLEKPVIVGSDPHWLAFPDESDNAHQAAALFDGGLDAGTFRRIVAASGVRYLVTPKWEWIGWERWTRTPGFPVSVLYDDNRYLVLRVT